MRILRRTGATARTAAGYARSGTLITASEELTKKLLKEGGWGDVTGRQERKRVTAVNPAQPADHAQTADETETARSGKGARRK